MIGRRIGLLRTKTGQVVPKHQVQKSAYRNCSMYSVPRDSTYKEDVYVGDGFALSILAVASGNSLPIRPLFLQSHLREYGQRTSLECQAMIKRVDDG